MYVCGVIPYILPYSNSVTMSVARTIQSKRDKQVDRLRILREKHPVKIRRDVISTSSRTKLDRLVTLLFKAEQLARDSKMKLVIFSYDPNDSQGTCKQYCFAPNQEELVAQGFYKKWTNDWQVYCKNLEVLRQAEVPKTSNSVQDIIDMVAASTEIDSTSYSGASTNRVDSRAEIGTNGTDSDSTEAPTNEKDLLLDSGLSGVVTNEMYSTFGTATNKKDLSESYSSDTEDFLATLQALSAPESRLVAPSKADKDMFLVPWKENPARDGIHASRPPKARLKPLVDKEAAVITPHNSLTQVVIIRPSNASKLDTQATDKETLLKPFPSLVQKGAVVNTSRNSVSHAAGTESHAIKRRMKAAANERSMHSGKASKKDNPAKSNNRATIPFATPTLFDKGTVATTSRNSSSDVGHVGIPPSIASERDTAALTRPSVSSVTITTSKSMSVGVDTTELTANNTKASTSSSQSFITTNYVVSPRNNFVIDEPVARATDTTPICEILPSSSPFVKTSTGQNAIIKISAGQVRKLLLSNPELKTVLGNIVGPSPGGL